MFPMQPGTNVASPDYRYFHGGKETTPEDAGKWVALRGTYGWTWRPIKLDTGD